MLFFEDHKHVLTALWVGRMYAPILKGLSLPLYLDTVYQLPHGNQYGIGKLFI